MYEQQWHLDRCKIKLAQPLAGLSRFLGGLAKHRRGQNCARNFLAEPSADRCRRNRTSAGSKQKQWRLGEFALQIINDGGDVGKMIGTEPELVAHAPAILLVRWRVHDRGDNAALGKFSPAAHEKITLIESRLSVFGSQLYQATGTGNSTAIAWRFFGILVKK